MIAGHAREGRVGGVVESVGRLGAKDPAVALSLTRAAATVGQAVQGDAMNIDDVVRSRPARRAVVAMRGGDAACVRLPSAPMGLSVIVCRRAAQGMNGDGDAAEA
eukprot:3384256-Prymnesium_polylepis.1